MRRTGLRKAKTTHFFAEDGPPQSYSTKLVSMSDIEDERISCLYILKRNAYKQIFIKKRQE